MTSEAAQFFMDRCYEGKQIRSIHPYFNVKYEFENKKYIFTRELLDEIIQSGKVKATYVGDKSVNLVGIEGMNER
ncbi:hypothetical protein [Paenibacillus oleatilyticus]|uniref:hypothetical protein n=1 Tax=Paenibacillus oleatilyticus TaxID=2594886 RepID=UPI001C1F6CD9|nr:hypothetical protein [Paenibacillus oleatilyticus]MBU7315962.1 hypothetical protein [Paenibacillus oleatilyticus]